MLTGGLLGLVLVPVDEADPVLIQEFVDLGEPVRLRLFGEGLVHLVEGERPGLLALLDEGFQNLVVLPVHRTPPAQANPPGVMPLGGWIRTRDVEPR